MVTGAQCQLPQVEALTSAAVLPLRGASGLFQGRMRALGVPDRHKTAHPTPSLPRTCDLTMTGVLLSGKVDLESLRCFLYPNICSNKRKGQYCNSVGRK